MVTAITPLFCRSGIILGCDSRVVSASPSRTIEEDPVEYATKFLKLADICGPRSKRTMVSGVDVKKNWVVHV